MEGFKTISMRLKEMYQMITLGGDASLELKDSLDPFSEGIEFEARTPRPTKHAHVSHAARHPPPRPPRRCARRRSRGR